VLFANKAKTRGELLPVLCLTEPFKYRGICPRWGLCFYKWWTRGAKRRKGLGLFWDGDLRKRGFW